MKTLKSIAVVFTVISMLVLYVCSVSAQTYDYGDANLSGDVSTTAETTIQKEISLIDCAWVRKIIDDFYNSYAAMHKKETANPDSYRLPVVFED